MITKAEDLFSLDGKIALVTGASSGLGYRFARVLAAHGAKVVVAARRTDRLEELVREIEKDGGVAAAVEMDVAVHDTISSSFDEVVEAFGVPNILVNNAGIARRGLVVDFSPEDWRDIMQVNLDGVWFVAQEAAKRMIAADIPGSIINTASILGRRVAATMTGYAVTKAAVIQLTRAMAVELAQNNIRVNAIAPGYILTEINAAFFETEQGQAMIERIPQRRIGAPSDLDGTLLLLASDAASGFMTGTTITVDGGHVLAFPR
jgi:NAD(P)-dependent dehydrogenase (short-subunit alcohol dehydrogenase family)